MIRNPSRVKIEHARMFAASKGWTVADEHVYVDDGISGAEFANRPGFLRLMNSLKPRARFQILIMSEESRLGREAIETAYALKQLITAGVRVFFYLENRERTLDGPTDKLLMSVTAFADELEREKARQRTYDAMQRKARAGHVTGGRLFGYENVPVLAADGTRSHVTRRIHEDEAAIVRRIFEMSAGGMGYTRIAKALNAEAAPCPRPQLQRPAGWSPSTVNEVLHREAYRGVIVWNRSRKRNQWGQHRQHARPNNEWLRMPAPELRIVTDELWSAAHARLGTLTRLTGTNKGGLTRDLDSRYLLPGFARCGVCGGGMTVTRRRHGRDGVALYYSCLSYWKRGRHVCPNGLSIRMEHVDRAVLEAIGGSVLRPTVVGAVIDGVVKALNLTTKPADVIRYRRELASVSQEIDRLTDAIAAGGPLSSLLEALNARQSRRSELSAWLDAERARKNVIVDRRAIERTVGDRLADWRGLLTNHVKDGANYCGVRWKVHCD